MVVLAAKKDVTEYILLSLQGGRFIYALEDKRSNLSR